MNHRCRCFVKKIDANSGSRLPPTEARGLQEDRCDFGMLFASTEDASSEVRRKACRKLEYLTKSGKDSC